MVLALRYAITLDFMGMGLDHCIHCAFSCLVLNMLHDSVLCDVWIIYMVKCIWKKKNTRVRKHNLRCDMYCVNYIHGKMYMEK